MSSIANAHNGTQQNEVESFSLDSWGSILQFFDRFVCFLLIRGRRKLVEMKK